MPKNYLKIAPKVIFFKVNPNPMVHYQLNMVQRWITTWGRLITFLVKFLKGQRSKVNALCQNWLVFTLYPNLMALHEGRLVKVWVKFLKGQRSTVYELCKNWLKIPPKLIFYTINPNRIMQFQPNMVQI